MKKMLVLLLVLAMALGLVACGNGGETPSGNTDTQQSENPPEKRGSIMWLSAITSGSDYDATINYLTPICAALGYEFFVVHGDSMNDAAANLANVKNNMRDDCVGLIVSQDGGLAAIMEEYPDLWVAGWWADLRSVFYEDGSNHACLSSDKFLGTIADGYTTGYQTGIDYANYVIANGFKTVSTIAFPAFAHPNKVEAVEAFTQTINEYNATAAEPIQIVGENTILMFTPLEDSWFLEEGRNNLDCIVAFCAGQGFVYTTMMNAIASGNCSPDTKMITGGFYVEDELMDAVSENGPIVCLQLAPSENSAYPLILIDNAVTGNMPADFEVTCVDSGIITIDSVADMDVIRTSSLLGTSDPAKAKLLLDDLVALCGRNNPDLTWSELVETFQAISVESIAQSAGQ